MANQQMSNYFVNLVEDIWFGQNQAIGTSVPANLYLCMFTTSPTLADSVGVEAAGNGYVRKAIPNTSAYFSAASATTTRTKLAAGGAYPLTWFTASGTIGPIVATGIRDAITGGNLLLLYEIVSPQTIANGNIITFSASDFSWVIN